MRKKTGFLLWCIILLVTQPAFSAQLSPDNEEILKASGGKFINMGNYAIDLNVPIEIPKIAARHSAITLWGTLIRPKGEVKARPTILISTAYRREMCILMGISLLEHGYNLLAVDNRGTGSSQGLWGPFDLPEQYDIKYVIDSYIPSQPWSDGTIGMFGMSYMGIIQLMAAGLCDTNPATGEPVHLKAIFPIVPMSDPFRTVAIHGGNFNEEFMVFWIALTDMLSLMPGAIQADNPVDYLLEQATIFTQHLQNLPETIGWLADPTKASFSDYYKEKCAMLYWPDKPAAGWKYDDGSPIPEGSRAIPPQLPVFMVGGWYDIFTQSTLETYAHGLKNHANGNKGMIIGPWYHGTAMGMGLRGLELQMSIAARWFNWKLKGEEDSFMREFPVLLYVMGADKWRAEKSWPLPSSRLTQKTLYLSKQKSSKISGDWFSSWNSKRNLALVENNSSLDYAGDNPVLVHNPSLLHGLMSRSAQRWLAGGSAMATDMLWLLLGLPNDAYPWEDERWDEQGVLTFTTEALDTDVEITGPITLTFWASSTFSNAASQEEAEQILAGIRAKKNIPENILMTDLLYKNDVQWVAEINDVFANGRAKNITSGWLSAWNRPYDPADPTKVDPAYKPHDPLYIANLTHPITNPVEAGKTYCYKLEIWPTCNVFKKGHRIRVSLSGSDFPHLLPVLIHSDNTIVLDAAHPARMEYTATNTAGEGVSWKWTRNIADSKYKSEFLNEFDNANTYLLTHVDPVGATQGVKSETDESSGSAASPAGSSGSSGSSGGGCFIAVSKR